MDRGGEAQGRGRAAETGNLAAGAVGTATPAASDCAVPQKRASPDCRSWWRASPTRWTSTAAVSTSMPSRLASSAGSGAASLTAAGRTRTSRIGAQHELASLEPAAEPIDAPGHRTAESLCGISSDAFHEPLGEKPSQLIRGSGMVEGRQLAQVLLGRETGQQHPDPGVAVEVPSTRCLEQSQVLPCGQVHLHQVVQPCMPLRDWCQAEHPRRRRDPAQHEPGRRCPCQGRRRPRGRHDHFGHMCGAYARLAS